MLVGTGWPERARHASSTSAQWRQQWWEVSGEAADQPRVWRLAGPTGATVARVESPPTGTSSRTAASEVDSARRRTTDWIAEAAQEEQSLLLLRPLGPDGRDGGERRRVESLPRHALLAPLLARTAGLEAVRGGASSNEDSGRRATTRWGLGRPPRGASPRFLHLCSAAVLRPPSAVALLWRWALELERTGKGFDRQRFCDS